MWLKMKILEEMQISFGIIIIMLFVFLFNVFDHPDWATQCLIFINIIITLQTRALK